MLFCLDVLLSRAIEGKSKNVLKNMQEGSNILRNGS